MIVWLIKLEEQVPIDKPYRPYRLGMLADELIKKGCKVIRWSSDFNHYSKSYRFNKNHTYKLNEKYTLEFLYSKVNYSKSVSARRLLNNLFLAHSFKKIALNREKPDLIVCAMPTPELAKVSSDISKKYKIPLIVDGRDYWPDLFKEELPKSLYFLSYPIILLMKYHLKIACSRAMSLIGITDFYLKYLLSFSSREESDKDKVFSLGYDSKLNVLTEQQNMESSLYWEEKININITNSPQKIVYFAGRLNKIVFNAIFIINDYLKNHTQSSLNFIFIFCGSGQYESEIKNKLKNYSNCFFPGEVNSTHLIYLRKFSFVAIQPIENRIDYVNSLSNKFFEYISSGLPILTSLKGNTKEEIEKNSCGLYYSNAQELHQALQKLTEDKKLYNSMCTNAYKLFYDKYDSNIIYKNYAEHIINLLQIWQRR